MLDRTPDFWHSVTLGKPPAPLVIRYGNAKNNQQ